MSTFTPESINIKHLAIDSPPLAERFEPENLLTESDWEELKRHVEKIPTLFDKIDILARIKLISPQRIPEFAVEKYLDKANHELELFVYGFKRYYTEDRADRERFIDLASRARQVFNDDLAIVLDESDRRLAKEDIKEYEGQGKFVKAHANFSHHFKMIFPEEPVESYVSEEGWRKIKEHIESERAAGSWYWVVHLATDARLLFPKRFSELGIDREILQKVRDLVILSHIKKAFGPFTLFAWHLKILTADDVRVTDAGIELIKHPKFTQESPTLPERRKF